MFTAEQAKEMFEWSKDNPQRWMAIVQTLVVDVIEEHGKTRRGASAIAKETKEFSEIFKALKAQHAGEAPTAAAGAPGPRLGGDGEPLSPEQAALEAQMDLAIGSAPVNTNGGGHAPGPGKPRVGADGQPLDDAQASIEAQMDAIAGPRP